MERVIKFRAWDKEENKMIYEFDSKYFFSCDEGTLVVGCFPEDSDYYELNLQAYTGMKDKIGRDIYEGDIIERIYKYEVKFKNGAFYAYNPKGNLTYFEMRTDMRIIGNIFETPELLSTDKTKTV